LRRYRGDQEGAGRPASVATEGGAVPIEFDDNRVDVGGVDDRRGGGIGLGGGGLAVGGGAGIVGLVIYLLMNVLGGGGGLPLDTGTGADSSGQHESSEELQQRCNSEGALDKYTDCRLIKVYDVADATWKDEFARRGIDYSSPRIAFFTQATQTGCGAASADVGPFYCPADQEIYFELGFLDQLQQQFGAQGEFAQAYIAAHEFGHHLQTLLGTERQVRAQQQRDPDNANQYSVGLELQADCYAGVWSKLADQRAQGGITLTQDNIAEAVRAAEAVGDDRIQQKTQGRVDPESWTHGSAEQRKDWFLKGAQSGNIDSCNTFK
jgi:predicted metalloprotease